MADTLTKVTPLGLISVEITLEGEASQIPTSEVLDLVKLLRETADNLEAVTNHCVKGQHPAMSMGFSFKVH